MAQGTETPDEEPSDNVSYLDARRMGKIMAGKVAPPTDTAPEKLENDSLGDRVIELQEQYETTTDMPIFRLEKGLFTLMKFLDSGPNSPGHFVADARGHSAKINTEESRNEAALQYGALEVIEKIFNVASPGAKDKILLGDIMRVVGDSPAWRIPKFREVVIAALVQAYDLLHTRDILMKQPPKPEGTIQNLRREMEVQIFGLPAKEVAKEAAMAWRRWQIKNQPENPTGPSLYSVS